MWISISAICDAPLWRSARLIFALLQRNHAEITVLVCEKIPIRYGFGACVKAVRYSVNIALGSQYALFLPSIYRG